MAASRFSSDVLEMFYGPISQEENARLQPPIRPSRDFDFNLVRTNFSKWLRVWRMTVPVAFKFKADILKFAKKKTKSRFVEVIENFRRRDPAIFNKTNVVTVSDVFRKFIDEVKGEIEAWSQRGSGWLVEGVLQAYINVAPYQPFRGGSCIILPEKLKNKKSDHQRQKP